MMYIQRSELFEKKHALEMSIKAHSNIKYLCVRENEKMNAYEWEIGWRSVDFLLLYLIYEVPQENGTTRKAISLYNQ